MKEEEGDCQRETGKARFGRVFGGGQWYGHVSRSSGLAKTILQGTVKGGRRQGRQRKRWEESIRDQVENRGK